ncbi:MAG: HEAT repeat domain-containing protein [Acidobacteriota bacterium]
MHRPNFWPLLVAGLVLAPACSSEPAEVALAREVIAQKPGEDPAYHLYALSIMGDSEAPHARSMILDAIAGEDRVAASEAIQGLQRNTDEETRQALHAAFGKGGSVQALAASVLAFSGDGEAIEWLAEQLGQGGLPGPAMAALAATEHSEAVRTALRGLIWSKSLSTRNKGYAALGEVRAPWAVELLLEGLDKEFGRERVESIVALGRVGDPAAAAAISGWVNTQGLVLASLEALGRLADAGSLGVIEPMLEHEQALVRAYAAAAAWRLGARDAAMAAIPELVADADPAIRRALAEQLSGCVGDEVTAWLSQLAADDEKDVRAEAYRGLVGRRQTPGLVTRLVEGAQDADYVVAAIALSGLARVGDASHSAALGPLLESDNPYLAISAAHTVLVLAGSQP